MISSLTSKSLTRMKYIVSVFCFVCLFCFYWLYIWWAVRISEVLVCKMMVYQCYHAIDDDDKDVDGDENRVDQ